MLLLPIVLDEDTDILGSLSSIQVSHTGSVLAKIWTQAVRLPIPSGQQAGAQFREEETEAGEG